MLVAGGRGERAAAGEKLPKQFRSLAGKPLLVRSHDLLVAGGCNPVIAVVPAELLDRARDLLPEAARVVAGGATRAGSVGAGLALVESERVVIHDAVRPFAGPDLVRKVVDALDRAHGAIAAAPVEETLKRAEDDRVVATVERGGLWRAQTPQAFRTEALRPLHLEGDAAEATDDAVLLERAGLKVVLIPASRLNLKITFPEDFALGEALLETGAVR